MSAINGISACRVTLMFEDAAFAWSETYWCNATDITLAQARAAAMLPLRNQLSSTPTTMLGARISKDNVFRDSLFLDAVGLQVGLGIVSPVDEPRAGERPYSVILLRGESGSLYRKSMYLGGVPSSLIIDPVGPVLDPAWAKAYRRWIALLSDGLSQWGFKARLKAPDTTPEVHVATASAVGGQYVVTTIGDAQVAVNQFIAVRNVQYFQISGKPTPLPNGYFQVVSVADVAGGKAYTLGPIFNLVTKPGSGFASRAIWGFVPFSTLIVKGETHRKRGVRSGRPLGRRPTRA